jgi:alpha/beta superfamily hydrolase
MAHGFSAVKEMAMDRYAEVFCAAGMTVLAYDHRNLGASDGKPRQEINPWAQSRDYRYAIEWLSGRPEADADRIAVWGSSFSGGEVIVVGSCEERVKAVVANVPFAGLPGGDYQETEARFEAIRTALLDESGKGPADAGPEASGPYAVVQEPGNDMPVFLSQSESTRWFLRVGKTPGSTWQNQVTLRAAFDSEPAFDPGVCVSHVSPTPLLMVVATRDNLAETAIAAAAFDRAGQPKQIEMIEGDHFSVYEGNAFLQASSTQCEFLLKYL